RTREQWSYRHRLRNSCRISYCYQVSQCLLVSSSHLVDSTGTSTQPRFYASMRSVHNPHTLPHPSTVLILPSSHLPISTPLPSSPSSSPGNLSHSLTIPGISSRT